MGILFLLGAILCGSIGTLSIFAAADPESPKWLSWVSWFIFTPTFYALFYAMTDFGVAGAFALWAAGVGIITAVQGWRWGDRLSTGQLISMGLVFGGLITFGWSG